MIVILTISGLLVLLLAQVVERYFYQKDITNKLNDSIKAVMSRNINEYLAATNIPKQSRQSEPKLEDIDLSEADDETFDKAVKTM